MVVWSPLGGGFLSGKYKPGERTLEGTRSADAWAYPQSYFAANADEILETLLAVADEIGRSPAQVALRWVLEQPAITSVIHWRAHRRAGARQHARRQLLSPGRGPRPARRSLPPPTSLPRSHGKRTCTSAATTRSICLRWSERVTAKRSQPSLQAAKTCELHVHIGGSLFASDLLDLARDYYEKIDWSLFVDSFERTYHRRPDPVALFREALRSQRLDSLKAHCVYGAEDGGDFAHFQAKFNLAICIYRHWWNVLGKPEEILQRVICPTIGAKGCATSNTAPWLPTTTFSPKPSRSFTS